MTASLGPLLLTGFCLLSSACGGEGTPARYGQKIRYRQGRSIVFPDFTLTFTGQRRVVPPQYPHGWWTYDFEVRAGEKSQTIIWSAGTGLINATDFTVGSKKFTLKRVMARALGQLAENELVINPASAP